MLVKVGFLKKLIAFGLPNVHIGMYLYSLPHVINIKCSTFHTAFLVWKLEMKGLV